MGSQGRPFHSAQVCARSVGGGCVKRTRADARRVTKAFGLSGAHARTLDTPYGYLPAQVQRVDRPVGAPPKRTSPMMTTGTDSKAIQAPIRSMIPGVGRVIYGPKIQ